MKSQPGKPECPRTAQHKILCGRGQPKRAGGRAGWPRSARTRPCRPAPAPQSGRHLTARAVVLPTYNYINILAAVRQLPCSVRHSGVLTRS